MADERLVTSRRPLQPVCEVAAIACSCSRHSRSIDEREAADRLIGGSIDVLCRTLQRVAEDIESELLAISRRAAVVSQKDYVSGTGEQMIVPSERDRVLPHVVRAAVDEDEHRILLRFIERRGKRDHVVKLAALCGGECEVAKRLPVDLRRIGARELSERAMCSLRRIHAYDFGRFDCASPSGDEDRCGGTLGN